MDSGFQDSESKKQNLAPRSVHFLVFVVFNLFENNQSIVVSWLFSVLSLD